jgi:hypothetical protein
MNGLLKSVFVDMVEDAMAISTWMYNAMPNPEDGNEIWVDLAATAMDMANWAELHLDNLVRYHSNRSHNVKQVLESS